METNQLLELVNDNPTLFIVLMLWSLLWKGLALWRSARLKDTVWFVLLLIINTLGLLEIIYYFLISRGKKED